MTTFSANVDDSLDNGLEFPTNTFDTTVTLGVGNFSSISANTGLRFINVSVPQGATINSADITLYNQGVLAGSPVARWYAWDDDDAPQFSSGGDVPSNVTKTTAFTAFTVSTGDITHSITSVIQEIVNRGGWVSGNAINLIAFDNSSPLNSGAGWDGFDQGSPSLLEIDYTTGGGGTAVPVFFNNLTNQGIA